MTKRLRVSVAGWVAGVSSLSISALSMFYFGHRGMDQAVTVALALATVLLNAAAIPFFVIGMRHFHEELRRTYRFVCIGIALFAFAQLQIPIAAIYDYWFIVESGLVGIPFSASVAVLLLAAWRFARLLNLKSWMMSLPAVMGVSLGGGIVAASVPFIFPSLAEKATSLPAGFIVWTGIISLISAGLIMRIVPAISNIYANALTHLNTAMAAMAFGAFHYVLVTLFISPDSWYVDYSLTIVPLTIGSGLFVWAGTSFNLIGERQPGHIGSSEATSLDIITYVASLASDQRAIDSLLNDARSISAVLVPGQALDIVTQRKLANVYLRLEAYLTTQEKMQLFSKESLRGRVARMLRLDPGDNTTFWPLIVGTS